VKLVIRTLALMLVGATIAIAGWLGVEVLRELDSNGDVTTAVAPPLPTLKVLFPEGFTREQMADRITEVNRLAKRERRLSTRLAAPDYLRLTLRSQLPGRFARDKKARSLEGFLFPATYEFTPRTTTKQLVAEQLEAFRRNWAKVDLRYARSKNLTPYDVLIIASLIEKEVVAPDERALVASVIYNRLRAGMRLDIDATTRYALKVPPTEPLRQSQLDSPHPYNTRVHHGLPPGPIANPGLASMQAAAHPKQTKYLYFVRKPDRVHHFFTDSEAEFLEYQRTHGF
jgi:UPF0755 protein